MRASNVKLSRVRAGHETQWHVHRGGQFIGSVVAREGGYEAARLSDGALASQRFLDINAAALWLAALSAD